MRNAFDATIHEKSLFQSSYSLISIPYSPTPRYLCAVDKNYWDSLSPTSKTSLELQGSIFSETEAIEFVDRAYAKDAVNIRIWDDLAKIEDLATPDLEHFIPIMQQAIADN